MRRSPAVATFLNNTLPRGRVIQILAAWADFDQGC